MDVDQCEEVAAQQGIRAMPTFLIFKNGAKADEIVGASMFIKLLKDEADV